MISVTRATEAHVVDLAASLRPADVAELAALGRQPEEALRAGVAASTEAYAGLIDDRVFTIFGICPHSLLSPVARIWLLASEEMVEHGPTVLRTNRRYIAHLRERYRLLYNFVHADNVVAIKWLGWLGFTVSPDLLPLGLRGEPFRYFEMRS